MSRQLIAMSEDRNKYAWIGVGLAFLFWILETAIHYFLIERDTFAVHLFPPDPHELWKRILVVGLLIVFGIYVQRGVNARQRAEQDLVVSEARYRTLIEEALNPVFLVDGNGRFVKYNRAALEFFECDAEHLQRTNCRGLLGLDPLDPGETGPPLDLGDGELDIEVGGGTKTMLLNVVALTTSSDEPLFVAIGQDITERNAFESGLALALAELEQIFYTASSAMRLIDRDFKVLMVNRTFTKLSGIPAEQAVGTSNDAFAKVWESITAWPDATTMIMKDASVFEVQGPLPAGEPSTRSKYFNLGTHQAAGLGGHLRPDLFSSIYAIAIEGKDGAATRGVVFHGPSGESVFSVYIAAEGSTPSPEALAKFEATMALIKSLPRVCGGS